MTSIVDELFAGEQRPIAYYPLVEGFHDDAALGTDITNGAAQTSAAGPFTAENVMRLDGSSQDLVVPNFSAHFNGKSAFTMIGYAYFDAQRAGAQYIYYMTNGSEVLASQLLSSGDELRTHARTASSDPSSPRATEIDFAAWVPFCYRCLPEASYHKERTVSATAGDLVDGANWSPGNATFVWGAANDLRIGGLGGRMTGRLAHLAFYDSFVTDEKFSDIVTNSDSGGVWAEIDLAASGEYKIDGTVITTDTLDYWIYSATNEEMLYYSGTDFDIASGACTNKWFLPNVTDEYMLVLRDPATDKSHAQLVPVVAA